MVQTFTTVGEAASDVIRSLSRSDFPLEHLRCARRQCRKRGAPLVPSLAPEEAVGMTLSTEYFTPPGCRLHSVCSLTRGVRMCKSLVSWENSFFFYYLITRFTVLQNGSMSDLKFMKLICQKSYYED